MSIHPHIIISGRCQVKKRLKFQVICSVCQYSINAAQYLSLVQECYTELVNEKIVDSFTTEAHPELLTSCNKAHPKSNIVRKKRKSSKIEIFGRRCKVKDKKKLKKSIAGINLYYKQIQKNLRKKFFSLKLDLSSVGKVSLRRSGFLIQVCVFSTG